MHVTVAGGSNNDETPRDRNRSLFEHPNCPVFIVSDTPLEFRRHPPDRATGLRRQWSTGRFASRPVERQRRRDPLSVAAVPRPARVSAGNRNDTGTMATKRDRTAFAIVNLVIACTTTVAVLAFAPVMSSPVGSVSNIASWSPVSVSMLRTGEGWALARYNCATASCVGLWRTTNGAATWKTLTLPSPLRHVIDTSTSRPSALAQLSVSFVDARDGWIYGSTQPGSFNAGTYHAPRIELWSTHDGGVTWSSLPAQSYGMRFDVLSVGADRGSVYAIGWSSDQRLGLWRSPVSTDSWRRVATPPLPQAAGGTSMQGALVFNGASGWLLVGNDRGVTGSARMTRSGRWVSWSSPCATIGDDFAAPVAYSSTTLVDVCTIGGYGGSVAPGTPRRLKIGTDWLLRSTNGGLTFTPIIQVGVEGRTQWLEQVPGLPASPAPGVLVLARSVEHGQTATEHLVTSRDGGRRWTVVYTPRSELMEALQFVTFATSKLGVAISAASSTRSSLVVTHDGGRTWRQSTL